MGNASGTKGSLYLVTAELGRGGRVKTRRQQGHRATQSGLVKTSDLGTSLRLGRGWGLQHLDSHPEAVRGSSLNAFPPVRHYDAEQGE